MFPEGRIGHGLEDTRGFDLGSLKAAPEPEGTWEYGFDDPLGRALKAVTDFPCLVIALLNGSAFGGGLELAEACDLRVGAEDVKEGVTAFFQKREPHFQGR